MTALPEFLAADEAYAATFTKGSLPLPPRRRVAVLTCMDGRLDPAKFLGLQEGDAHVIRNAGGRATADALRSLIISEQLQGTREVVVIHHTDCGMLTFSNEDIRDRLRERFGRDPGDADFLFFDDLARSVHDDVATIRDSPFIPQEVSVSGLIYDVKTGRLHHIL